MVRRRTRIARIGVRRERAGGASGAAPVRAATRAAWRRRARSRGPSGRPAVRAEPRPVRRAAGLAARAGGYCFIYDVCPRGQRSSGIRTRYTSVFTDCSTRMSFRTGGRPGNRTRAYASSAPICLRLSMAACATATNRSRFGGGAPAGLVNPGSRASGTSGPKYIARSVPARVAAAEKTCNALNGKGNFLFDVEAATFSVDSDIRKF